MLFPRMQETSRYRNMTTVFGGYNRQLSLNEGEFFDMQNMTSKYFPILSPRQNRGIIKKFVNPQGILDKEDLWWVDDRTLYRNGEAMELNGVYMNHSKTKVLAKMGAYIIIMPDKIWCKTNEKNNSLECGYMHNTFTITSGEEITFSICDSYGRSIDWKYAEHYKDMKDIPDGSYMMSISAENKPSLKVYSASTGIWMTVASPYIQISFPGIGKGFEKEDGIKITTDYIKDELDTVFVNDEGDGLYSTNTYIIDRTDDSITIPGIYNGRITPFTEMTLKIERNVPDMAFITECNNRLWGCSEDGHEIYCSKLGDVKNWNCFRGVSTDSWAATIGSDGKFTGAITYLGYPIFFKEDSLIKIAVSAVGGHQIKETMCRGVQNGSERSLAILNEILFYKSPNGIVCYNGSLPYSISDAFGDVNYYDAVAGVIGDKYYVSMRDADGIYSMFVYDSKNKIWCKEDNAKAISFCRHNNELYYIDANDNTMKSVGGTLLYDYPEKTKEDKFGWFVESGPIGYSSPDNKYVGRISLRITLEFGTDVDFYMQYDSCGEWEHMFNMSGSGTRSYSIPIIPRRCDHFRYKIKGKGECKIHSITKTIEEGSDI